MKKINNIFLLSLFLVSIGFYSCDTEEESISFSPGENLMIAESGNSDPILTYQSSTFYVRGFTVDETYSWSVSGDGNATLEEVSGREGEFVSILAEDEGNYTVSVSNNVGLEGSYTFAVETVNEFLSVGQDTLLLTENQYMAGGDTLFLPINISARNLFETTADFSIVDGTAVEGTDFEVLNETNVLTFPAGETQAFVEILLSDNTTLDGVRDFSITLDNILSSGPKSAAVEMAPDSLEIGQSVIYISDNAKEANLAVEGEEVEVNTAGNYFIDVDLTAVAEDDVTITYTVTDANGIPVVGADQTGGVLEIFEGKTTETIVLEIDETWVAEGAAPTELNVELTGITSGDGEAILGGVTTFTVIAQPAE